MRWLRAHAAKYHIDVDHVGVWGDSAGGHLAALLGTAGGKNIFNAIGEHKTESDRMEAVCDFFGPSDFTTINTQAQSDPKVKNIFFPSDGDDPCSRLVGKTLGDPGVDAAARAASPVTYISGDCPPFLIVQGLKDTLVPYKQSVELADKLKAARIPVELELLPNAGHGGSDFDSPAVLKRVRTFFEKNLTGQDAKVDGRGEKGKW